MKSVKPGRGPSMMGGIGSIFGIVFGIIWTCGAASIGAPGFFLLFGVAFIGIGVVNAVYSFKNASGDNRYSAFDIVDSDEEPDPLNVRFGSRSDPEPEVQANRESLPTAPTAAPGWGRALPSAASAERCCRNRILEKWSIWNEDRTAICHAGGAARPAGGQGLDAL